MSNTEQSTHPDLTQESSASNRASKQSAAPSTGRPPRKSRAERRAARPKPKRLSETTGPDPSTPVTEVRLNVGTVTGPHGIDGEVKVLLTTDDPDHFLTIRQVFLGDESRGRRVLGARLHDRYALMRLKGITTPEAVSELRGQPVRIAGRDARPLAPGEYYLYQLIGLTAYDEEGAVLGTLTDIMETGANDVFIITSAEGGDDLLVPNHPSVVLDIDPAAGKLIVRPLVYLS